MDGPQPTTDAEGSAGEPLESSAIPQDSAAKAEEPSEDLFSQTSEGNNAGRHPDVYCDECEEEIVGVRYKCIQCRDWNYCSECFQVALHPRHDFKAIDPPQLNDSDDFDGAGSGDDESSNGDERVGVAECAHCHADVLSPSIFFQCPECVGLEITCLKCQGSSRQCINHGENVTVRDFIWYGEQLATNVWINDEPSAYDSELVNALKSQDMDGLDALGRSSQQLNATDMDGRTPLHVAAHLRLQACAKFLLMRGANPEIRDRNLCTPLHQAILSRNEDMAFLLLDRGANPHSLDNGGNTALHLASMAGCIDLAQYLATAFPGHIDKRNKVGQTALFRACQVGNYTTAQILLDAGANPNTTNDMGATQLGELAASDEREAVMFLLNAGTGVDSPDENSRTSLYRAAENDHFGLCNDLLQYGANPNVWAEGGHSTPLGEAAAYGHLKTVEALLEGGAEAEGKDNKNRSALFRAAEYQQHEVCRALLDRGASPSPGLALPDDSNEECSWPVTPLQIAAFYDAEDVAEVLIEHGALLEERDGWGRTALFLAAERGHLEACRMLVAAGADCDSLAGGSNVVAIAAQRGHLELVKLLLQAGAKAFPPPSVRAQKWKNFVFDPEITLGCRQDILEVLRAYKHR